MRNDLNCVKNSGIWKKQNDTVVVRIKLNWDFKYVLNFQLKYFEMESLSEKNTDYL